MNCLSNNILWPHHWEDKTLRNTCVFCFPLRWPQAVQDSLEQSGQDQPLNQRGKRTSSMILLNTDKMIAWWSSEHPNTFLMHFSYFQPYFLQIEYCQKYCQADFVIAPIKEVNIGRWLHNVLLHGGVVILFFCQIGSRVKVTVNDVINMLDKLLCLL